MSDIVLYQIPSSEIDFLLQELERPYYWNPAHSHLMHWDLRLTATDIAITSDPLAAIADLPGDIVLDGLLDDGIDSKLCHQIVNAFREQRDQCLYLIEPIWDLFICQPFEHESDETKIEFGCGMAQSSLKVFDQTLTTFHPSIRPLASPIELPLQQIQFSQVLLFQLLLASLPVQT